jgi:thiamine biosynthesis lipoprotein
MPHSATSSLACFARRLRIGLGTFIAIEAHADTERAALTGIEAAFAAVAAVEARMHPQRPGSDLQRINDAAPGERVGIDAATHRLLRLARCLNELTLGIFDPCLPARPGRLRDVRLSGDPCADARGEGSWLVCQAPVALDFGGFAKGHAIDCAVQALIAAGCGAGLVNAGGDVRLFGARTERMLLRSPDGACQPLALADTALAVSAAHARSRPRGHVGYYVRGSRPALQRRFAAVLAPTAVIADALTKCLLLCPPPLARRTLREFGAHSAT